MIGYFLAIYIVGGMAVPILAGLVSLLFHPTSSDSTPPFGVALLFGYVLMLITAGVFAPLLVSRTAKKKNRAREAVVLYWQAEVARGVQELERAKPRMTDDGTPPPLSARS
jgi:MFS family permease